MTSSVGQAEQQFVTDDLPCLFCEYNLRTLSAEANCPECGNPVLETLRRAQLVTADPEWLRLVYDDLGTMLGTGIPAGLFVPALWVLAVLGSPFNYVAVPGVLIGGIAAILHLPATSQFVLHVSEAWAIRRRRWCRVPRYCTVLIFVAVPLGLIGIPRFWGLLLITLGAATVPLYPVFMAGSVEGVARLAGRPGLVRLVRIIRWNGIGVTIMILAGYVLGMLYPIQPLLWPSIVKFALWALSLVAVPLGFVMLSVLSITLMIRIGRELHRGLQAVQSGDDEQRHNHGLDTPSHPP